MYSILIFLVEAYIQWSNYTVVRSVNKNYRKFQLACRLPLELLIFFIKHFCVLRGYVFSFFMLLKFDHCDFCNFKFFYDFFHTYKLWWLNTYNGGKIPLWKPCTLTKLQIAAHFSKTKFDSTNTFAHHCRCYSVQRTKLSLFRGMILIFLFFTAQKA